MMSTFLSVHMDRTWFGKTPKIRGFQRVHVHVTLDWGGGGILVHGIAPLHHAIEAFSEGRGGALTGALLNAGVGVVAGAVVLAVVAVASKLWRLVRPAS